MEISEERLRDQLRPSDRPRSSRPRWVQICWNDAARDYDVVTAENINMQPIWPPDLSLRNSMKLGFADKTIDNEDHPYVRQLRGLTD